MKLKCNLSNCYEKSICSGKAVQRKERINNEKSNYKGTYKAICHHRYPNFDKDIKSIFKVYFKEVFIQLMKQ